MSQKTASPKTVLVTGASSGIGYATAQTLARAGYIVYASARKSEGLGELEALGCRWLQLDVTSEASIQAAFAHLEAQQSAIDVLINNAGYGEMGAVEEVSLERWRAQFETNVFAVVRLCQRVLPGMRARGRGHIVNIGSMGGEFTTPFGGAYHASKYALEAVSDALRFEVAPFGVAVTLIQPGAVQTPLAERFRELLLPRADSPYASSLRQYSAVAGAGFDSGVGVESPEAVAQAVLGALESPTPPARVKVGAMGEQLVAARRSMPDHAWDDMLRGQYGLG